MSEQRNQRSFMSRDKVEMIYSLFIKEKKTKEICELMGLSKPTVSKVLNYIQLDGKNYVDNFVPRKKPRSVSLTAIRHIEKLVTDAPACTQKSMKASLAETGIELSQPTISRRLKNAQITRKRLSLIPIERNSPRLIEDRLKYAMSLRNIEKTKIVYVDETGFNLHTNKHYGYSMINTKAYDTVPANRGRNVSLLCSVSIVGIVAYELIEGPYNSSKFVCFLVEKLFSALT